MTACPCRYKQSKLRVTSPTCLTKQESSSLQARSSLTQRTVQSDQHDTLGTNSRDFYNRSFDGLCFLRQLFVVWVDLLIQSLLKRQQIWLLRHVQPRDHLKCFPYSSVSDDSGSEHGFTNTAHFIRTCNKAIISLQNNINSLSLTSLRTHSALGSCN